MATSTLLRTLRICGHKVKMLRQTTRRLSVKCDIRNVVRLCTTTTTTTTTTNERSSDDDDDFFGFSSDDRYVVSVLQDSTVDPYDKYNHLLVKNEAKSNEEKLRVTSYGVVRLDDDNKHCRDVAGNSYRSSESQTAEEQLHQTWHDDDESVVVRKLGRPPGSYIEDQFFFQSHQLNTTLTSNNVATTNKRGSYFDEQYFEEEEGNNMQEKVGENADDASDAYQAKHFLRQHEAHEPDTDATGRTSKQSASQAKIVHPNVENPQTAYDYVKKMRMEKAAASAQGSQADGDSHIHPVGPRDSKGFRILKGQTVDLDNEPEMFVLQTLKNGILYNEHDILAISKPYGLPCHYGKGYRHHLTAFLPKLAKFACRDSGTAQLFTVHRLDVDTTGVLLLAKTQAMATKLQALFAEGKIVKTYWALTKGVPSPTAGTVDIPMGVGSVAGKERMVLRPELTEETKGLVRPTSSRVHRAVTSYQVLASEGHAALVELKPATGIRHQLRVHLAFGLGCPVLGDHKYSHLSKLAPQKLASDVLQRLHVRQSKVRDLPMHLHARGVIVPDVVDGRDLHIGARLPKHFKTNMMKLKISTR